MSRLALSKWMRRETATAAIPLTLCVSLLALVIVPNYVKAVRLKHETSECAEQVRAVKLAHASVQALEEHVRGLEADCERRGRELPLAADQGKLLGALGRSAEHKGILSSESKSGRIVILSVPGVPGSKASRRAVETQMRGNFDALHDALEQAEGLRALVSVRAVEFIRSPSSQDPDGSIEAHFVFDEYFAERAAAVVSAKDGG